MNPNQLAAVDSAAFGGGRTSGPIDAAATLTAKGMRIDFEVETFIAAPAIAATLTRGAESAGKGGYAGRRQEDDQNLVAHTLRADGYDASEDGTGRGTPLVPVAVEVHDTLSVGANQTSGFKTDVCATAQNLVRRLTPRECERLQGFPDDYTRIPWRNGFAADGPRYKACGNSMAVNCMRWIGMRISMMEALK